MEDLSREKTTHDVNLPLSRMTCGMSEMVALGLCFIGFFALPTTLIVAQEITGAGMLGNELAVVDEDIGETEAREGAEQDDEEVWESYSDYLSISAAAKEVTNGVRVQDIVEPTSEYRYAAFGKEDPFIPPFIEQSISVRLVSPLQEYDLNQLTLVGVWQANGGERKAMVRTAKNEGYVVKVDDPIAKNGQVSYIGDSNIVVRLFHLAPDGTRKYEDRNMLLSNKSKDTGGELIFVKGEQNPIVKSNNKDILPNTPAAPAAPVAPAAPEIVAPEVPQGVKGGQPAAAVEAPQPDPEPGVLVRPDEVRGMVEEQIKEVIAPHEVPAPDAVEVGPEVQEIPGFINVVPH